MNTRAALSAMCLALSACTHAPVKPVITLDDPILPTVKSSEVECIAPDTYRRLWERDLLLQSALRQCRAVVDELSE